MRICIVFLSCFAWLLQATLGARPPVPRLIDPRIVGGYETHIAVRPFQVSLKYKSIFYPDEAYRHNCGGSIYSPRVIITAAHCVIGKVPSEYKVVAGSNNRAGVDGIIVPVQEYIVHENFNPDYMNNDIALVILSLPLPINNYTIAAIELANSRPLPGSRSVVSGWGSLMQGGTGADKLQQVQVPIVSNEDCNEDYEGAIDDSMLCAGLRGTGGKDACQGDSGGPLTVNGKLAGVVSWGWGCALPEWPGVYADIMHLKPWILQKLEEYEMRNK